MFLCEIHPDHIVRWFMEMFIDSYDWVMVPNVYAMSQHADGGLITTKPYFSGSSYVKKMSNHLITKSTFNTYNPQWFISISYLESYSKKYLVNKIHKRISDVIKDTFDPYDLNIICKAYFIEKGKKRLVPEGSHLVLNTMSGKYSYDKEMTLKDGSYGTHLVLSLYPSILDKPNKRIRKLWSRMFWDIGGQLPRHLACEENQDELLAETLERVIRDRCPSFIAHGKKSIDVQLINERREFRKNGNSWGRGWTGALNYCLKYGKHRL